MPLEATRQVAVFLARGTRFPPSWMIHGTRPRSLAVAALSGLMKQCRPPAAAGTRTSSTNILAVRQDAQRWTNLAHPGANRLFQPGEPGVVVTLSTTVESTAKPGNPLNRQRGGRPYGTLVGAPSLSRIWLTVSPPPSVSATTASFDQATHLPRPTSLAEEDYLFLPLFEQGDWWIAVMGFPASAQD
ncbi:MAG: hypothetical protein KatS3mg111_3928 [Pirellulaceae bacterium]|nr:MAG: hypothetical protein KatS3mg111_3928 [Pirellulaceae bacterium]